MPGLGGLWSAAKGYGGRALSWGATNPFAKSAMIGAGIGGLGGLMSDNGSLLGGAFKGAMWGGALGGLGIYGSAIGGMTRAMMKDGMKFGPALSGSARMVLPAFQGEMRGYGSFIKNNLQKAYNPIRGIFK